MIRKELTAQDFQTAIALKRYDTCIIVHIYYATMWGMIHSCLLNLGEHFDLYVTIPHDVDIPDDYVKAEHPDAHIYRCENRGRDIMPFLKVFEIISKLDYAYVCKIHTKRSLHILNGDEWLQDMLSKLLGSPETISRIKGSFDSHPDWGLIAPGGHVVPSSYFWNKNAGNVIKLAHSVNIPTDNIDFVFVAGSMFWFRPQAFQLLLETGVSAEDFEHENGQQDGTLAHAFERFFGMILKYSGYVIAESDKQEVRAPEISFQFRLLLEEFHKKEQEVQVLTAYVARNERRLRKIFGSKIWELIKVIRQIRSAKKNLR